MEIGTHKAEPTTQEMKKKMAEQMIAAAGWGTIVAA
jgi:hypothetical protein